MIEETLIELIEFIKDVAPEVWAIVLKQVYIQAFQLLIPAVFILIAGVFAGKLLFAESKKNYLDQDMTIQLIGTIVVIGALLAVAVPLLFMGAFGRFFNPEFYAIQYLLNQLP